eukprot:6402445-Prymnesium_polylepis.1
MRHSREGSSSAQPEAARRARERCRSVGAQGHRAVAWPSHAGAALGQRAAGRRTAHAPHGRLAPATTPRAASLPATTPRAASLPATTPRAASLTATTARGARRAAPGRGASPCPPSSLRPPQTGPPPPPPAPRPTCLRTRAAPRGTL